ncbi:DUF4290 domain-containing protein [Rhodoflexus caldus]|uniref:DUF4290 domain-containing protein n=1 Tax=Rhodoflexus caldus TaxID=2891236 RepID=UPI00202A0B3C|nr:DUF4290 domain-containing protein [Rhodoflexus caldus]
MENFEYNTERSQLILKEYGRSVQQIADYIASRPTKEERTALSHVLIGLMKQLNPSVRENIETPQRIWDHLHHMAGYKLDIDGPFPPPQPGELFQKPQKMPYNSHAITYRHYGKNVELMIEKAIKLEDPEERKAAAISIFKLMRTFYAAWNKENTEDEVIAAQLRELSNNQLDVDIQSLRSEYAEREHRYKPQHQQHYSGHSYGNNKRKKDKRRK